jgi:RNA polymerase sigma factor (sigma-70 family)
MGGLDDADRVAALVRGAATGDERCWASLVDRFTGLVWYIARSFALGDADAADVSQTVWLRLAENLNRIEQPERVGAWLATTARRESMRVKRLSGRMVPFDDVETAKSDRPGELPAADMPALVDLRDALVWRAFASLPERGRTLLLLLLLADPPLSYHEISETLGMPIGSIGPTRARTLTDLRKRVEALGISALDSCSV